MTMPQRLVANVREAVVLHDFAYLASNALDLCVEYEVMVSENIRVLEAIRETQNILDQTKRLI